MTDRLASIQTPWTDIIAAQQNPALRTKCLEQLTEKYREPIRAFIARALEIHRPEAADDLTQGFFLHFFGTNCLDELDRERGRLRYWFMTSVRNFVRDEQRKGKRHNPASPMTEFQKLPSGDIDLPGRTNPSPEEEFNRRWARDLFEKAVQAFRMYCRDKGKMHYFQVFERHVLSGDGPDAPSYADTARELGISIKDVDNYLGRSRKKFQEILRELVRSTVARDEDVEKEMMDLLKYFT